MKVVFIGAGNVATHLAIQLYEYRFDIVQVYSRTCESAETLARQVGATAITDISAIQTDADIYIFSVKDSVLANIASQLLPNSGFWVHTAGSMPIDVFTPFTARYGVLYPFQTFSKVRHVDWKTIPIFIEASDSKELNLLNTIANKLSDVVLPLSSDKRKYLHLTGVFACNFVNHMYTLSSEILEKAGLPFDIALPLIDETAAKVHSIVPLDAQTGPAVRFDNNVMDKHLKLINDDRTKEIYRLISESIHQKAIQKKQ